MVFRFGNVWIQLALFLLVVLSAIFFFGGISYVIIQHFTTYAAFVQIATMGSGIVTTLGTLLYRHNHLVYLLWNRIKLALRTPHSWWLADFDFDLLPLEDIQDTWQVHCQRTMEKITSRFRSGEYGESVIKFVAETRIEVLLEDAIGLVFTLEETSLHLHLDRKILVPFHLYDTRLSVLQKIAENARNDLHATGVRCTLEVYFKEGAKNPYYGFFVRSIPSEKLFDFKVNFLLSKHSDCQVMAENDKISVIATKLQDGFQAFSDILSLQPLPVGD